MKKVNPVVEKNRKMVLASFGLSKKQRQNPPSNKASGSIGDKIIDVAVAHRDNILLDKLGCCTQPETDDKGDQDCFSLNFRKSGLEQQASPLKEKIDAKNENVNQFIGLKKVQKNGQTRESTPWQNRKQ